MIRDIISIVRSGGQTGVDIAALRAARSLSIPTGGTMPRGWRTLDGPRPEYRELYGMVEHASDKYPPRTHENVRDSDMTIQIAVDFRTAGEVCTERAILQHNRLHWKVPLRREGGCYWAQRNHIEGAACFIRDVSQRLGRPIVLNVAGNSERTAPGIEKAAEGVVRAVLERAISASTTPK